MNLQRLAPKAVQAEGFLKGVGQSPSPDDLVRTASRGDASVSALQQAVGLPSILAFSTSRETARGRTRQDAARIASDLLFPRQSDMSSRMIGLLYELFCAEECVPRRRKSGRRPMAAKAACSHRPLEIERMRCMTIDRIVMAFAGAMILASLALSLTCSVRGGCCSPALSGSISFRPLSRDFVRSRSF